MLLVVHLIWVVIPAITALKCGTPGVPANSYIKPLKETYDDGDVVRIFCKHKFHLVADENWEHQTCVAGVWNGTRPTCLEILSFGSDFYFASLEADEGLSITSAGEYRRQLRNTTEHVYLSVAWERKRLTTEAIVFLQGNFSAETRNGRNLPLAREVVHYHDHYGVCHQRFQTDMYFCSAPEPFGSAKVQVRLSKPLSNLKENPVEIILRVPDSGILVLDHANISCGMPPAPWQGSVVVNVNTATYQCTSGYELKGDTIKTCDNTGNPANLWPPGNPLCVESPAGLSWGVVAGVIFAGFFVLICLVLGVRWLYLQMKKRETPASTGVPVTELKAVGLINHKFEGFSPNSPSSAVSSAGYTGAVQYPLIVSDLYTPESDYLTVAYDDVGIHNVYETVD